jgi:hypothetical protein
MNRVLIDEAKILSEPRNAVIGQISSPPGRGDTNNTGE